MKNASAMSSWKRIREMSGAEIADRLRQHTMARLDLIRYRMGADFAPGLLDCAATSHPHFFFLPDAVTNLCGKLRELFPETAAQIVERSERICAHRFDLLGYGDVDYGPTIDWHADRVHGKRSPRKPWFQIKYLNFEQVGDSKVIWELNRHQHLVTLAKAFRLSGERKFASELFRQWEHWHAENPYPIGINWASSLEVGFRALSWIWVYFLMADSPEMPKWFRSECVRSLAVSGRHIHCYLSTYFSPNTHLLGEAVALFFIGTLCPEIPQAEHWKKQGLEILEREARRQVQADGLHFEHSLYYHVYALDFFLHVFVLASANDIPVSTDFNTAVEKMLTALAEFGRGGVVPQIGDDDGGRVFDPARNRQADLLDPLATGTALSGRGDLKAVSGGVKEETLWLLGESGIEEYARIPVVDPMRNSVAFQDSGYYLMRGDQQRQLALDAGPQGTHSAGHGHADALSLTASAGGRELLVDSGTYRYVGPERNRFRGTRAHNTLVVAQRDQADPKGPFSWGRLPNVKAEGWIVGRTFDLFVGSHDGYSRLPNSVIHRRFVFSLKSGFWLVRDQAFGYGKYQLDLYWHLAPAFRATNDQSMFTDGVGALRFVTLTDTPWACSIEEQLLSPVYGRKERHCVVRYAAKTQLPAEFVTLFSTNTDHAASDKLTRVDAASGSAAVGYFYEERGEHSIVFGPGKPWRLDSWSSDAEFLYWGPADNHSQLLICCGATYVERAGLRIVTADERVLRTEVIGNGAQWEVVSTDPHAVVNREAWESLLARDHSTLAESVSGKQRE